MEKKVSGFSVITSSVLLPNGKTRTVKAYLIMPDSDTEISFTEDSGARYPTDKELTELIEEIAAEKVDNYPLKNLRDSILLNKN
jgi:hypothetical protein